MEVRIFSKNLAVHESVNRGVAEEILSSCLPFQTNLDLVIHGNRSRLRHFEQRKQLWKEDTNELLQKHQEHAFEVFKLHWSHRKKQMIGIKNIVNSKYQLFFKTFLNFRFSSIIVLKSLISFASRLE